MNAVLIGVTVVLVVLVGVYAIGFQRGKSTADTPILTGDLGGVSPTPPAPIRDPIAGPGRLTPGEGPAPQGPGTVGGPQTEPVRPSSVAGQVLGTDPRQADTNYFELDVLPYRDAEEAVRFLTANGLPAAAVPQRGVDVADARAKNRPCIVFLLEGIPSTLYRGPEGQQVRQRIEPEVRRLGQLWRTQHRGASTFAQAYWRKHQPGR